MYGLIDEPPIMAYKTLALALGLNEALFVQNLHFWLKAMKKDDIYNTVEQWQKEHFPYFSVSKLERIISKLRRQGIIETTKPNAKYNNQTNYYTINYENLYRKIAQVVGTLDSVKMRESMPSNCGDLYTEITKYIKNINPDMVIGGKGVKGEKGDIKNQGAIDNPFSGRLAEVWDEWVAYRKEMRKPLIPTTLKRQVKKLKAMGDAKAILAIETAMDNGWQGFFEPQDPKKPKSPDGKDWSSVY